MANPPTPPTTPSPPPTGTNSSLVAPLLSETFTNRNAEVALTADVAAGTGTSTIAQKPLNLVYDAASGSYTLTANGRTLVFGPSDIDQARSTSTLTVYVKGTSNANSDTLTMTKAGTSGRFTYRYVGGAFWERSLVSGNTLTASAQSSVYGAVTPNAGVPRTGAASYAIDLIGYVTSQANPFGITGSGRLDVDFARGLVVANGTIPMSPATGFSGSFRSAATLSSTSNSFTGSFNIDAFGSYSGTIEGLFFGPAADEVGGAWTAQESATGAASGVILGRRDGQPGNVSFAEVRNNDYFYSTASRLDYRQTATTPQNGTVADAPLTIQYNAASGSYTLVTPDRSVVFRGGGANVVNGSFMALSGTANDRLSVSGTGTYVRAGKWISSANVPQSSNLDIRLQQFAFGMPTATAGVPRSGEGAYVIDVAGSAADGDYPNRMDFSGTGLVRVNFGSGALSLSSGVNYREDWFTSGRAAFTANGQLSGTGTLSSSANAFNGSLTLSGVGAYTGTFAGQLFGPAGQELGATFKATDGTGGAASGTILGKRDDSILAAEVGLTDLGVTTTFSVGAARIGQTSDQQTDLTYNPAAGSYRINTLPYDLTGRGFDVTLGTGDRTMGPDGTTGYDKVSGDVRLTGYLLNPGPNNPRLALTYASFGDFMVTYNRTGFASTDRFLFHYGIPTTGASLPRSGVANYSGLVLGQGRFEPISLTTDVTGTSAFQIDFGAMTWTGSLALRGAPFGSTATPGTIGTFGYSGQVATNGFFGNASTPGTFGSLMGRFYGPGAAEIGANWNIGGTDPNGQRFELQGITVGRKN
ncbi:lipopolysaccharide export system protein LptA [Sphingomonas kaistensis]|uniref:Lipopolysaccharide export system protein LptA n=1 Tax=Sphingomonas kaistensis TaxID=298708 RepID=A0A7X6BFV9_9SPHN|nr:transferrin-binding protein-like solute binding protein [Sphingomonas kaistensis]NJC04372.1 lipopolysaccharide export system protein LptA [Sphingomonas kaistensis]